MPLPALGLPPTTNTENFDEAANIYLNDLMAWSEQLVIFSNSLNNFSITSTSSTSMSIGYRTIKTFTMEAGKSFQAGQSIKIVSTSSGQSWMNGDLLTYNATTGETTAYIRQSSSSGTFSSWNIIPSAPGFQFSLTSDAGANDSIVASDPTFSFVDNQVIYIQKSNTPNLTSNVSINVYGTTKNVYDESGRALQVGAIKAKMPFFAVYDTSLNVGVGGFRVIGVRPDQTKMYRDTGTANAMVINDPSWTIYEDGRSIVVTKGSTANTNITISLNINGIGNALVVDKTGANIPVGGLKANQTFTAMFDATLFSGSGAFKILEI